MKESELQKSIIEYLNKIGCMAWRNNTGAFAGMYKGKSRFVRFGPKGAGDIFCIMKDGRFLSVEVKAKGKKPTPEQLAWMVKVDLAGGFGTWADSWEVWESICKDKGWPR